MAESPAHKFGQLIGDFLETLVRPQLEEFCRTNGLYLDHQKRDRPARPTKTVAWTDAFGNVHDLDFVIERGGTDRNVGTPLAFIESAWRRYTKHSRNKAQEIQGAILPLAEKYRYNNPFLGAVLAGEFTDGSLQQLRSHGFQVLFIPYRSLVTAFRSGGFDVEFDEGTPDRVYAEAARSIEGASSVVLAKVRADVLLSNKQTAEEFFGTLKRRLSRHVTRVIVLPLYGRENEFETIQDALRFLDAHLIYEGSGQFRKYELRVDFSNGDNVMASFADKTKVREFLVFVASQ